MNAIDNGLAVRSVGEVAELLNMTPIRVQALERSAFRKLAGHPQALELLDVMRRHRTAEDRRMRSTWSVMLGM